MGGEHPLGADEAWRILGVPPGLDGASLRRAFLEAVKASHPDRPGGDAARLRAVVAAYALLKSPPGLAAPSPSRAAAPLARPLVITPAQAVMGGSAIIELSGERQVRVQLPAGLRHGDRVRIDGRPLAVSVRAEAGAAVLGDHLCLTVEVEPDVLRHGGRITVSSPTGDHIVWVSRTAAGRGFVRVTGLGLPARAGHARGHLFVRLRPTSARTPERASRDLLRRFTAAWAA